MPTQQQFENINKGMDPNAAKMGTLQNPWRTPGGKPGEYFQGTRPGQFGFGAPAPLPSNIDQIRGQVEQYRNHPAYPFGEPAYKGHQDFMKTWEGVHNAPENFNAGPLMAAAGWGEDPNASSLMGWQPAQAEQGMYSA